MTNERLAWEGRKCRRPMWMMGVPVFCDDPAFGEQLPQEILYYERHYNPRYNPIPYCYGPCCPGHGGPREDEPRFFRDGLTNEGRPMWCCVGPDFVNLQESLAGFDGNPFKARQNYLAAIAAAAREGGDGTAPGEAPQSGGKAASPTPSPHHPKAPPHE